MSYKQIETSVSCCRYSCQQLLFYSGDIHNCIVVCRTWPPQQTHQCVSHTTSEYCLPQNTALTLSLSGNWVVWVISLQLVAMKQKTSRDFGHNRTTKSTIGWCVSNVTTLWGMCSWACKVKIFIRVSHRLKPLPTGLTFSDRLKSLNYPKWLPKPVDNCTVLEIKSNAEKLSKQSYYLTTRVSKQYLW